MCFTKSSYFYRNATEQLNTALLFVWHTVVRFLWHHRIILTARTFLRIFVRRHLHEFRGRNARHSGRRGKSAAKKNATLTFVSKLLGYKLPMNYACEQRQSPTKTFVWWFVYAADGMGNASSENTTSEHFFSPTIWEKRLMKNGITNVFGTLMRDSANVCFVARVEKKLGANVNSVNACNHSGPSLMSSI